jgi:hypothetical protein
MGTFPSRLKFSIVKRTYKAGDKQNIANFRPISLLIHFAKVFDKIIYSRICNHIVQNFVLAKEHMALEMIHSLTKHLIF